MLRTILAGFVSVVALAACQPLQAQTTFDPLFFCGVAGGGPLTTTQGTLYTFPATERPSLDSVSAHPAWTDAASYSFGGGLDGNNNIINLSGTAFPAVTEPGFLSGPLEIRDGTTVVGTQEWYVVIFATVERREAFLYYLQQRELAPTYSDYVYFSALASYEFWMGQENEGMALYTLYTALGDYYYLVTVDGNPQYASYYYWYYRGLGAYYYFEGLGDSESAALAFAYHYQLAVEALEG